MRSLIASAAHIPPARRSARFLAPALAATALALSACTPIVHSHGYAPRAGELEAIEPGVDNRASVELKLGRPSTIGSFNDSDWYYISIKTETMAFYAPEVVDQKVVTVSFDETGRVEDVGRYGLEDGQVVDLVTRTTPTSGRRLTVLQQIFANIGRFGRDGSVLGQPTP